MIQMTLKTSQCARCGCPMLTRVRDLGEAFDEEGPLSLKAQMETNNVKWEEAYTTSGDLICEECWDLSDKVFMCSLCKEYRPVEKIQEIFGIPFLGPISCLCTNCCLTVSSEIVERKRAELTEVHKWGK